MNYELDYRKSNGEQYGQHQSCPAQAALGDNQ